MFERQRDAYVRKYGRPYLFITVTTNPKWTEILESLTQGQQPHERLDLPVIFFSSENSKPFEDFERRLLWLFGGPSIKFQKRDYHMHYILLWLSHDAKFYLCDYFSILFAYTVPKPNFCLYNFLPTYFLKLYQNSSGAENLS